MTMNFRKLILAVNIRAAFPHKRGVSAFHRFIERGCLPQQQSLETEMKKYFFDHINSAMRVPLSFFDHIISEMSEALWRTQVVHILYFSFTNGIWKNVTIIWDYSKRPSINSFIESISYITALDIQ